MASNYVPAAEDSFYEWEKNLIAYATSRYKAWGIPDDRWEKLLALQSAYHTRYDAVKNSPGAHAAIQMRKEARKAFEAELRIIIKAYITYNPAISDEDRILMGLPVHDTKPTRVKIPTDHPDHELDLKTIRCLLIYFFAKGMKRSSAKPYGCHGAELRWAILDHVPVSEDELIHSSFATRSPFVLEFKEEDRGKKIYFCLAWENTRGEKGPKSEIFMAIIP